MFRALIPPIFRSSRLLVTACGIRHQRCCRPAASSVHYTTSCKHSLVLLRMGEIIARNMLSWLELRINKPLLLHLVVCSCYYVWSLFHQETNPQHFKEYGNKFYICNHYRHKIWTASHNLCSLRERERRNILENLSDFTLWENID